MEFEVYVPPHPNFTTEYVINHWLQSMRSHQAGDWPVIPEKYVTFGASGRLGEIDMGKVAGEINGYPKYGDKDKVVIDINMYGTRSAEEVKRLVPYMEKTAAPMVVILNAVTDGNHLFGPYTLHFGARPKSFGADLHI